MNVDLKVANKVELEYTIKSASNIVFQRLSTPHGLSEWFADDVNILGNVYIFIWNGSIRKAELVEKKENRFVKFRWIDDDDSTSINPCISFKLNKDDLTRDLSLVVTEDIDEDEDLEEAITLWNHQINELKRVIGA